MSAVSSTLRVVWVMKASLSGIARGEAGHVGGGLDQDHLALGKLAHRADGLGVAGVADHDHLEAVLVVARGLDMDLRDQRTGGVDEEHPPRLGFGGDGFRDAVGGEDHRTVGRAVGQLLDEHRAARAQTVDDEAVVDDLVAHVDRRAPFVQRHLDDLDGAVDAGAEAARGREMERQGSGHWRLGRSAITGFEERSGSA